jgi:hypothetical protein
MGAMILVGIYLDMKGYDSGRPETPGQRLDRALEEQERRHQAEIRELERKVESARRLALMNGGDW